jgi:hypothetical protein
MYRTIGIVTFENFVTSILIVIRFQFVYGLFGEISA